MPAKSLLMFKHTSPELSKQQIKAPLKENSSDQTAVLIRILIHFEEEHSVKCLLISSGTLLTSGGSASMRSVSFPIEFEIHLLYEACPKIKCQAMSSTKNN
jgi:hypothetical protein